MIENKKLVITNVFSSGLQVVLIAVVYFFLYRFLLDKFGVELLGVWSVVLATTSLAGLANAGISTSVVRFAALYKEKSGVEKLKKLAFTAFFMMLILFSILGLLFYCFGGIILQKAIPASHIKDATDILPYSILCFMINACTGVYASILDGTQKNYIRSIVFSSSSLVLFVCSIWLVNASGFKGLAYAQVIQSSYSFLGCLIMAASIYKFNPFKWNWDKVIFKDIYSYGIKYQFISLASMLNDPLTKLLIVKFGGLAIAGYYEMATRLINQLRGVIINACQSLIPVMVNLGVKQGEAVYELYTRIFYFTFYISLAAIVCLLLASGVISFVWIGHYENIFITVLFFLGTASFINLLNVPAYFSFMANGNLNVLIYSHLIMSLLNAALGLILGNLFAGTGILFAAAISTIAGSLYTIIIYQNKNNLPRSKILHINMLICLAGSAALLVAVISISGHSPENNFVFIADTLLITAFSILLYFTFLKQQGFPWIRSKI